MGDLAALREHLLAHSVRRGEFVLKSGRRSSWFVDSKQTACRPDGMLLVADAALDVIPAAATAIGGLTMGADPVAFVTAAVAATRGRSLRSADQQGAPAGRPSRLGLRRPSFGASCSCRLRRRSPPAREASREGGRSSFPLLRVL